MIKLYIPPVGDIEISEDAINRLEKEQHKAQKEQKEKFEFSFGSPSYKKATLLTQYAGYLVEYIKAKKV